MDDDILVKFKNNEWINESINQSTSFHVGNTWQLAGKVTGYDVISSMQSGHFLLIFFFFRLKYIYIQRYLKQQYIVTPQ